MGFMKRLAQATVLAFASTQVSASILAGCANAQWNSTRDFFGHKFIDNDFDSDVGEWPFVATYYNTYVRVMVPGQDRFIVLHCTNDVPPRDVVGEDSLLVKIPVSNVAAMDGLTQKFVDVSHRNEYRETNLTRIDARQVLDYPCCR